MHAYLLAKTAFRELFLSNQETEVTVSLTQKDIEGILKVYSWRKNREVSYEEFKLLCAEWNKTCKLLTSGNFFLTIAHTNELFHERWFLSICKDTYPQTDQRVKEIEFLLNSRMECYYEKLRETPFLGHDFERRPIYSLEPAQLDLVRRCYRLIDGQNRGMVTRADLLTFYVLFRYLNLAKNRELSLRKDRKQGQGEETGSSKYDYSFPAADSHGHISVYCGELIELMNQTNLVARELLTTRECMNFLVRLLNNSILQPESLLKRAAEYFSQLAAIFEEGFASKVAQDIRVGLTRNGGNIDSAGFLKSEVQYLELFARADLWQTMGALRDGLWFRDLTAKSEDAIADSLMNSYISFRKSVNVLVNGDQQGSPAQGFKIGPNFKCVLIRVYSIAVSNCTLLCKTIGSQLGLETNTPSDKESEEQHELVNNSVYSIIKDYKDLAVEHHKKPQKPSDPSGKSQARDEEIAMGDISNIMPPQPIKRSTSICFTAESSKEEERPTKTNQTEIFPRQKASGFGHSSPSTTMQMPPLSPQPASKMRYGLKSSDNQASRDYGLPQQQVQKTLTPQETRPRERQPFVDVTPPIPTKLMLEQNLLEDDPVVIPPSPTHSNHYGITVLRSDTLHTNNLDKTQNGNMARSKSGRNDRNKLPTSQNKRTFGMADDEEYRIHDLQLDLVKTSNFGGPYLSAGVHASNKSYELKTLTGYEQVPVLRDPKDDHKRGSRTPKSTSKPRQAPPSQPLKKVPSKASVNQQEAQKENLDTRNRTSTNSYVFLRSKDGRMMDKSNLDTKKSESINFTQNSSSYSYHHQLGTGQHKNTHNSLEYEQDTYYLGPASNQPQNEFQFRLGPSTGSVSNLSMHKPQMQAIHQIELESPTEEGFADYVPKALRKKKQHPHILAKVDHRRDRSHSRLNGSVSSQSILDKQFKVAKVDTFENVMNNLRGGGHGSRSLYEDHFKKGFLN